MKRINLFLSFLATITMVACNKPIVGRTDNTVALAPTNIDLNAGNWKPVLLSRSDTFTVSAPAAVTSAGYIAELNEVKGAQKNLTDEQQAIVKYWSAGSVLRWNEILRELVAKYN